NWPETDVGAGLSREAPSGRRSISQAPNILWQTPRHMLHRLVGRQPPRPQLTADPATLGAAPRGLDEHRLHRVDPHMANLQRIGYPLGALKVRRTYGRHQPEAAVVGFGNRLLFGSEAPRAQYRTKDLLG